MKFPGWGEVRDNDRPLTLAEKQAAKEGAKRRDGETATSGWPQRGARRRKKERGIYSATASSGPAVNWTEVHDPGALLRLFSSVGSGWHRSG
jgi:hypothetical protein